MASTTTGTARGESPSTVSGSIYEEFSPGKNILYLNENFLVKQLLMLDFIGIPLVKSSQDLI
jgi:hypothetical protein